MSRAAAFSEMIKELKRLHAKYMEELPSKDIEAIYEHLSGPYGDEFGGPGGKGYGTEYHSGEMDRIIRGAPRTPGELEVFRGTTVEGATPEKKYPFTTSYDPEHAEIYAESWVGLDETNPALMLEIEVPEGSPSLMFDEKILEDITGDILPFGDEAELLLPHSQLELIKKYEDVMEKRGALETGVLKRHRRRYIPPYKARGGLIDGYT